MNMNIMNRFGHLGIGKWEWDEHLRRWSGPATVNSSNVEVSDVQPGVLLYIFGCSLDRGKKPSTYISTAVHIGLLSYCFTYKT